MIKRQNQVDKTQQKKKLPERLSWLHPPLGLKVKDCFPNGHKEEFQLNSGAHLNIVAVGKKKAQWRSIQECK